MKKYKTIRELFRAPSHWTKGSLAVTKYGYECPVNANDAVCFCLEGAIRFIYPVKQRASVRKKLLATIKEKFNGFSNIIAFNDHMDRTIGHIREVVKMARV